MANVNGVQCIQSCLFGWVVLDISVESSTECISFVLDNRCDLICVRSQSCKIFSFKLLACKLGFLEYLSMLTIVHNSNKIN